MSQVTIQGNASGTGVLTIAAPNTSSNYTLTLPTATTTLAGTDATQTLTNKTLSTGLVMGASPITLATAQATTSGTSIDFTSIPSWVKRITVMVSGVSTNGGSTIQIQIGAGSVTTSGYLGACTYVQTAGATGAANITTGFGLSNNVAASTIIHGVATLALLNSSTNIWTYASNVSRSDAASVILGSGALTLSGTLDRVRVTTVNGTDTFDAGSINIQYE